MKPWRSVGAVLLVMFLLLQPATADTSPPYNVVSTVVPYLPTEPFHVTDMRYPDKSNFETRTVIVHQPYQNGVPLQQRPVVFFVHGGGWTDGYADWYSDIVTPVLAAQQGWVVVNVDYRLTSEQVFLADEQCRTYETCDPSHATKAAWYDDNIEDVAAAFRWTVEHISDYGGDPHNIFLFGHSAGGHLVSLLATRDEYRALRSHMRGVISLSGAYDLNDLNPVFYSVIDQTFKGGHTDTAALDEASPQTYVRAGETLPSFYVLHCQFDIPSLPEQAISFRSQLEALGSPVEWEYLTGYTHTDEMTAIADGNETVTQRIVTYIQTHIRKVAYLPWIEQGTGDRGGGGS